MKACKNCGQTGCIDNIGGGQVYAHLRIRRYLCTSCGHAFYTTEEYGGPINRRTLDELAGKAAGQTVFDFDDEEDG